MAFSRAPFRARATPSVPVPVFGIGRRVHVACCATDDSSRVTLTDGDEKPLVTLAVDTEVAILAWRPNWSGNTRYRVRATGSGLEGWVSVWNLRETKAATEPAGATADPRS
jgi:hypothetical protein